MGFGGARGKGDQGDQGERDEVSRSIVIQEPSRGLSRGESFAPFSFMSFPEFGKREDQKIDDRASRARHTRNKIRKVSFEQRGCAFVYVHRFVP